MLKGSMSSVRSSTHGEEDVDVKGAGAQQV